MTEDAALRTQCQRPLTESQGAWCRGSGGRVEWPYHDIRASRRQRRDLSVASRGLLGAGYRCRLVFSGDRNIAHGNRRRRNVYNGGRRAVRGLWLTRLARLASVLPVGVLARGHGDVEFLAEGSREAGIRGRLCEWPARRGLRVFKPGYTCPCSARRNVGRSCGDTRRSWRGVTSPFERAGREQ